MITLLVADAQQLLADSLRTSLSLHPDFEVLDERPSTGLEAVEAAIRRRPDVALVDYWMNGMEGPAIARMVLKRAPAQKIVLLGWFHGPAEMKAARQAGAAAFLSKGLSVTDLAAAVRQVSKMHRRAVPKTPNPRPENADGEEPWERLTSLSPREVEILGQLALCGKAEEAAKQLSITPNTMRLHIQHILAKTGARSQVEAVAMARQHGLI